MLRRRWTKHGTTRRRNRRSVAARPASAWRNRRARWKRSGAGSRTILHRAASATRKADSGLALAYFFPACGGEKSASCRGVLLAAADDAVHGDEIPDRDVELARRIELFQDDAGGGF